MGEALPLAGVDVVALVETVPGPLASAILADLGASVTVVERPDTGDPARAVPAVFRTLGRNKRFVALDLGRADHQDVLDRLLARAEIVITGYRPAVARRLRVDADSLRRRHPHAVVVQLTAHGPRGPDADKPAHDLSVQALAGLLPTIRSVRDGDLDGAPVADMMTGAYGAIAALAGLIARRTSGQATTLDVSMRDAAFALNGFVVTSALEGLPSEQRLRAPAGYGTYCTRDGRMLAIAVSFEMPHWAALCRVLGHPDWATLDIEERITRRIELNDELAAAIDALDASDLEKQLADAGLPVEWVRGADDIADVAHVGSPIVVDGRRLPVVAAPDEPGAHTADVLAELGYSPTEIDALTK